METVNVDDLIIPRVYFSGAVDHLHALSAFYEKANAHCDTRKHCTGCPYLIEF